MNIEKERQKAKKWQKFHEKGKTAWLIRAFVLGAILASIYPTVMLTLSGRFKDMIITVPLWAIPFGIFFVIVSIFGWKAREKHYNRYIDK